MSEENKNQRPYKNLGSSLKTIREKYRRSIEEVSGAIEIDEKLLGGIESGIVRPPEDVLELLINYFDVKEKEAIRLWTLAGYEDDLVNTQIDDNDVDLQKNPQLAKSIIMLMALDTRTLYTDELDIHYDNNGLVLHFKQLTGQAQPVSVAKLGMSYDQAEEVLKTLERVLVKAKSLKATKKLSGPKDKDSNLS